MISKARASSFSALKYLHVGLLFSRFQCAGILTGVSAAMESGLARVGLPSWTSRPATSAAIRVHQAD